MSNGANETNGTNRPWVNPWPKEDPRSLLMEYQANFWQDKSRFKIGLWSRQTGKDFTTSGEATEDCFRRKTQWMIAAPSERQSIESLDKAKDWAQAFDLMVDDYQERREGGRTQIRRAGGFARPRISLPRQAV